MEAAKPLPSNAKVQGVRWPFAIAAIGLGLFATWRLVTGNLEAVTSAQLDAYLEGDTERMFSSASHEEQRLTGLTRENLKAVWRELVQPRLNKVTVLNDRKVRLLNKPPSQGIAEVSIRFHNGLTSSIAVGMFPTEDQPKRPVLFDTLLTAWFVETQLKTDHPLTMREIFAGRLACMATDRTMLEQLGIKGVFEARSGFMSWDQMERNLREYLSEEDSGAEHALTRP